MQQITKLCADSLRSFSQNQFGIQLKSSHAHELVAAYFGYSSRAALLADTKSPISNLSEAKYIVLTPTDFIKERCKDLHGLPQNLPHEFIEAVYSPLYQEKLIRNLLCPTLDYLAFTLAEERLNSNPIQSMYLSPLFSVVRKIQREGVKVHYNTEGVDLMVFREYVVPDLLLSGQKGRWGIIDMIELKRVAGYIGYIKTFHHYKEAETLDAVIAQIENDHQQLHLRFAHETY